MSNSVNQNVVLAFLEKSKPKQDEKSQDHTVTSLGSKAIANSTYFNIEYKNLKYAKIDQELPKTKLNQGFNKIMSQIYPDLPISSRLVSKMVHLNPVELLSRLFNNFLLRTSPLLIGLVFGFWTSLLYTAWSIFNSLETKIVLISVLYLVGYLLGWILEIRRLAKK